MSESQENTYWKGLELRARAPATAASNAEEITGIEERGQTDRRSFLKLSGFAFAGTMLSGCVGKADEKLIPYLIPPENIIPGRSYWYASTCSACPASCGILTKNRDGRPIKVEGNKLHPLSKGGLCAVGQASVLGLYDSLRLPGPTKNGQAFEWDLADKEIKAALEGLKVKGGALRVLSGTVTSVTLQSGIDGLLAGYADARHDSYDALSVSAILDSHERCFGRRLLPRYRFDKAQVVFSFGADFLGTWISPAEFTRSFQARRSLEREHGKAQLSRHIQVESRMSLTGSNADERRCLSPEHSALLIAHLCLAVAKRAGRKLSFKGLAACPVDADRLKGWADELWAAKGKALVICGQNDLQSQVLVNGLNEMLGGYGATLDIEGPSRQRSGSDAALAKLVEEMKAGKVGALFLHGVNPVYDSPLAQAFAEGLKKVGLVVSFAERADETAGLAHYICPDHHFLESWSDAEPVAGVMSLAQPAITPLRDTRSALESLACWSGKTGSARELLEAHWKSAVYPRRVGGGSFESFWDGALHRGAVELKAPKSGVKPFDGSALAWTAAKPAAGLSVVLYPKVGMLDGRHGHNAWLQELPDPVTKTVWDNYASLSPATAKSIGAELGDLVTVARSDGGGALTLPALIQAGQHDGVVAIALGYGRLGTDRFSKVGPQWLESKLTVAKGGSVGESAAGMLSFQAGEVRYSGAAVKLSKAGGRRALASTQLYHSLKMPEEVVGKDHTRHIIAETTLAEFEGNPKAGIPHVHPVKSLWDEDHVYKGHHWGAVIDLNACTGCSGCVVSCQAENNIPVVGKDEVGRGRDMQWLRIDRYYSENNGEVDAIHQPMMCQHCDNAPCETVCPVLATVHSSEGINQQVYNRCVGTRYCANNCPYKVRRFNWFEYDHSDEMQNMVLNPDVTVRSRGVMEKCSFCYQRIQNAKAEAGAEALQDGDIQTACQQSCPAQAITFGDMNDPKSAVARMKKDPRHYLVLEELNVRPSVGYMTKVRNRPGAEAPAHGQPEQSPSKSKGAHHG